MTEEVRERTLVLVLVVALAAGLGFDLAFGDVTRPERLPVPGDRFYEQASFCPGPLTDGGATAQATIGAPKSIETRFSFEPTVPDRLMSMPGPAARVFPTKLFSAAVGYVDPVVASSTLQVANPVAGAAAARCSRVAATRWYFAEGSSALGFDERLVLYNPFPDEAVARITFFTPKGEISRARLAEGIAVPAGDVEVVKVNEFVPPENLLGTAIELNRGRIVAWRGSIVTAKEFPDGLQYTLGSRAPALNWYLPAGSIEEGVDEKLSILNPTREEAVVSISLATAKEIVHPPKLVDVAIPPGSANRVTLSERLGRGQSRLGGASLVIESVNDVRVVAERTLWYDLAGVQGVSSEIGAAVARDRWMVAPALLKPTTDTIVVLNPTPTAVKVNVAVLDANGEPRRPGYLQGLKLKAGTRRRIEIKEQGAMLLVTADGPVVVERSATSGRDAAAVMGVPTR